jgi:23S rRNA pseudouridine2457 synthase
VRGHPREYWVHVEGAPTADAIAALERGVVIAGGRPTRPCRVRLLESPPILSPRDPPIRVRLSVPDAWLSIELSEGRNRQVRRMTASVGHPTLRLLRVRIGGWRLDFERLPPGRWRELTEDERSRVLTASSRP